MFSFKKNSDLRGELVAIDAEFDLPFDIKRIFYIRKLDKLERGFHAHRKCVQILVPIQGSFTLKLFDGEKNTEYFLDKSNEGALIPLYHWLSMSNFSDDCIIMVICSYKYDESEYIRDYDIFLKEVEERKKQRVSIQNFSLKEQTSQIKRKVMNKIEEMVDNTAFVMGKDVLEFEEKFKKYNNVSYCVAVSNGCAALKIAINALQLENPKVITQANTYVAVPLACEETNTPYDIIDIDDNLLLDLDKLEEYLIANSNSDFDFIVILVHLYGICIDFERLLFLRNKYGFKVIEDAAQAHGACYKERKLGSLGDIGCFSFYPSKNLGAFGEGGAIITNNEKYAEYCKYYRNYGSVEKYKWEIVGANERMDNIQGGILSLKLDHLDEWNAKRTKLAELYKMNIKSNSHITFLKTENKSNYHLFVVKVEKRDNLMKFLQENGIKCAIHYPQPFYETEAYKHIKVSNCDTMDKYKNKLISLPMYPELSQEEVLYVCTKINEYFKINPFL